MNYSDLTRKNLLVIVIKSVNLGKFSQISKDDEVSVRMQWGNFHTRTSYLSTASENLLIDERFVIDLNNDNKQQTSFFVDRINKNDLSQLQKEGIDPDTIWLTDIERKEWSARSKSFEIKTVNFEQRESDITINVEAYIIDSIPTRGKIVAK